MNRALVFRQAAMNTDRNGAKTVPDFSPELPLYPGVSTHNIRMVVTDEDASAALRVLEKTTVLGFDTESRPTFRKGESSSGPHLIQLAEDARVFLIPVKSSPGLRVARAILEAPEILKVGFGLDDDLGRLRSRLGISLGSVLDLGRTLPGSQKHKTLGARSAAARFLGLRLQKSKRIGTSNWSAFPLTERQMRYAADDAHVALQIYRAVFPNGASTAANHLPTTASAETPD